MEDLTEKTIDMTKQVLKILEEKYKINKINPQGNVLRLETKENREIVTNAIIKLLNDNNIPAIISPKKITVVDIQGSPTKILVKPDGKTGVKSPGISNEISFVNGINRLLELEKANEIGGITIIFKGKNKVTKVYNNIISVKHSGRNTTDRKKGDAILISSTGKEYAISLKKESAEYWESADNLLGAKAYDLIKSAIKQYEDVYLYGYSDKSIKINDQKELDEKKGKLPIMKISKELVYSIDANTFKDVCFGTDISNGGCIIKNDFKDNNYLWYTTRMLPNKIEYIISVHKIFDNISQIWTDDTVTPYILIRNDRTRNSEALGIPGIRVCVACGKRTANKKKLDVV